MTVLNIGSLNIDYVYQVGHFVQPGETLQAQHRAVHAGGKGLNQSIALARAGAKVKHAGAVGADGGMLREVLMREGIDMSALTTHEFVASGHTFIQVDPSGENGILYFPGTNGTVTIESMLPVLDAAEKDDIVMLQNELPNTQGLIEAALDRNLKVVLNPSPYDESLVSAPLERLYALILNETEARGFLGEAEAFGTDLMAKLIERLPNVNVVLTLGSQGACGRAPGNDVFFVPALKVKAVDTTAAGDTFAGFTVAALARGENLKTAMTLATKAAAISVGREGAATSIPTLAEVLEQSEQNH